MKTKEFLRQQLKKNRQKLSLEQQIQHALQVKHILQEQKIWQTSHHIALYHAANGEVSTEGIIVDIWAQEKKGYLPVICNTACRKEKMQFFAWEKESQLMTNQYGILEPVPSDLSCCKKELDLVLMPLLGFNRQGDRLGMGGGYYDGAFAERETWPKKMVLLGIAHSCQYIEDDFPRDVWDVKLDGVITEKYCLWFSS